MVAPGDGGCAGFVLGVGDLTDCGSVRNEEQKEEKEKDNKLKIGRKLKTKLQKCSQTAQQESACQSQIINLIGNNNENAERFVLFKTVAN